MGYHMFGNRVNTLPVGHVTRTYGRNTYYYYNGVFYKNNNLSGYIICRPPVGFAFNAYNSVLILPYVLIDPYRDPSVKIAEAVSLSRLYARMYPGYRMLDESFYMNNVIRQQITQYVGMDGIYYSINGGTYTVVDPPIGALTDRLPYDYEEIYLGGDLFYLVDNANIALTREKLILNVWGYDFYGDDRTLDTHIKLLRRSLGEYSKYIVTLRGVGYRFETESQG